MAVREVPRSWEYTCDQCSAKVVTSHTGYVRQPDGWAMLAVTQWLAGVGDQTAKLLICGRCWDLMGQAIPWANVTRGAVESDVVAVVDSGGIVRRRAESLTPPRKDMGIG
jgi:hypothetical protein